MADFSVIQEEPGRLVLGKGAGPRVVNLAIGLVLLGVVLYVLASLFSDSSSSGENLLVFILLMGFAAWRTLSSALVSSTAVVDSTARRVILSSDLLGIPLRRAELPFDSIRRVLVGSRTPVISNRSGARPVWRVGLETREGQSVYLNSNGTYTQMSDLGNKIAGRVGAPLADELKQVRNQDVEPAPIQDFNGGGTPIYAPPVASPMPLGRRSAPRPAPQANPPPAPGPVVTPGIPTGQQSAGGAPLGDTTFPSSTPMPALGDSGSTITPSMPGAPAMPDMGTMSMPAMTPLDLSGPSQPSSPSSPLGSSLDAGPSFSMPPLGGGAMGQEMGTASYSPPALGSADQPPLGTFSSSPGSSSSAPAEPISEPGADQQQGWTRPLTLQDLQKAIGDDPTNAQAYYQVARLWHAQGRYNEALTAYEQAVHLDPTSAPAQNDLGVLYLQRGKYREAEAAFRRASGLDPFFIISHYNLGLLLSQTRRRSEAEQAFTRGRQTAATEAEQRLFENAQRGTFVDPILSPQ